MDIFNLNSVYANPEIISQNMNEIKNLLLLIFLISLPGSLLLAQDVLLLEEGNEIECRIIEITYETIKYKDFDFPDGPLKSISKSYVFAILYENGRREILHQSQSSSPPGPGEKELIGQESAGEAYATAESVRKEVAVEERPGKKYKGNHFMIGIGYGNSYGGAGIRVQGRLGGDVGVGFHGGVGYFPKAPVLASGGVKFFPFRGLYIDTQFGLTGWEWQEEWYYSSYAGTDSRYNGHLLFGPSILTGVDWTWGSRMGYGFNAGIGGTYNWNAEWFSPFTLALDIGFVMRF